MKKNDCCASARQKRALGCGAKRTKEVWHLCPERHGQSVAPATQEFHRTTPRSAAGRVKGHPQPSRTDRRLQPNSAAVSAARLGNKRTAFAVHCPSPAGELDGETQFRYAAYVLTFLKFK